MTSNPEPSATSTKPWLRCAYVFAVLIVILAVVEVATWVRWKYWHWENRCGGVFFDATGCRTHFDDREDRWDGNALHVVWRADGTLDRDASFRAFKRIFTRHLDDAEVAHFESTEWCARSDTYFLACAIAYFVKQHGHAPNSLAELLADTSNAPRFGGAPLPRDRWGRTYGYEPPSGGRSARLVSLGADGRPGGTGLDADWFGELAPNGEPTWEDPLLAERP